MKATTQTETVKNDQASTEPGLKLQGLRKLSLARNATGDAAALSGRPLELDLSLIVEDLAQPRKTFDPGKMAELQASIELRGVKTPISVRPDPEAEGRYLINHGARRYRASKAAGKTTIPAFVDSDYTDSDQVIENIQRDSLTPREIADFVGRKLSEGKKNGEIAKELGMSQSFISQHATLLKLPDPIAAAFSKDRCRDVTLINELNTAYKKKSKEVTDWLMDPNQEITRGTVKLLREFLESKSKASEGDDDNDGEENLGNGQQGAESGGKSREPKREDPTRLKKAVVQVEHDGRPARLLLNKRPTKIGLAWFKYEDEGQEFEAAITEAKLVAIVEG